MDPASILNRATQLNPNNIAYWLSRGYQSRPSDWMQLAATASSKVAGFMTSSASIINRANQMNPNNVAYWLSRGYASRPENWKEVVGTVSSNVATTTAVATGSGVLGTAISYGATALSIYSYCSLGMLAVSGAYGLYRRYNNQNKTTKE